MPVLLAYFSLVLIWSTTPLAIQWSSQGTGFALAVLLRMLLGLAVAGLLLALLRIGLPLHARARRAYLVGGIGTFFGMALTYWGSRYLHSGLVSVMWGLSPLIAGILAAVWLGERSFTPAKLAGTLLGIAGLALIFLQGGSLGGEHAVAGLLALLLAVFLHTAVMIWLKQIGDDSPPLASTVGSLVVAVPMFALLWQFSDGQPPADLPDRAGWAIAYLAVFGSVIGFSLYYYLVRRLHASRVALITLITPVLALLLGHLLNGEAVEPRLWGGAGLILLGLMSHQWESLRPLLVLGLSRIRSV